MDIMHPIRVIYRELTSVYWQVAFVSHAIPILSDKKLSLLTVEDDDGSWFADPFILEVRSDEIDLIVEEYLTSVRKGIISLLTIRRSDNVVLSKKKVLELDTHLSFPFVYRENKKVYIFPENSASSSHSVYELTDDGAVLKIGEVVSEPLTDTAIINQDGTYYLFGTRKPEENGSNVRVYSSESLTGKYELYQEISVNKATARGASGIYSLKDVNRYYRISQDNEGLYGRGLVFQEIEYDPRTRAFSIEEIYRKYPDFEDEDFVAMHTYNVMGDLAVIDVKKYRHPFWGKLVNFLRYGK